MLPNLSTRRCLLGAGLASGAMLFLPSRGQATRPRARFALSDWEWRKRLSPAAYRVLRDAETERPYTSALLKEHRPGRYLCVGCGWALFDSSTKFDSGTGWPSFWAPLNAAVATMTDYETGVPRTEVHCHNCGGHLGHVFADGPRPTGKRYCMNGLALSFRARVA